MTTASHGEDDIRVADARVEYGSANGRRIAISPVMDYKGDISLPEVAMAQPLPKLDHAPDLATPEAAAAALRTFFRIADAWDLGNEQQRQLLGCGRSTFYEWKHGRVKRGLDGATLERLSHLFGIYAALQVLLPIPERAHAWIHRDNTAPLFGGKSALDRMLAGQVSDLYVVRQYLDAQRGGWA
jgi:hypothetical protein